MQYVIYNLDMSRPGSCHPLQGRQISPDDVDRIQNFYSRQFVTLFTLEVRSVHKESGYVLYCEWSELTIFTPDQGGHLYSGSEKYS